MTRKHAFGAENSIETAGREINRVSGVRRRRREGTRSVLGIQCRRQLERVRRWVRVNTASLYGLASKDSERAVL